MRTATARDLRRILDLANIALKYEADRVDQSDVDAVNRLERLIDFKSDETELKI